METFFALKKDLATFCRSVGVCDYEQAVELTGWVGDSFITHYIQALNSTLGVEEVRINHKNHYTRSHTRH